MPVWPPCLPGLACKREETDEISPGASLSDSDSASFNLPASARNSISTALIVHPVAALLTLIMLIFAIVAHFHSPAQSSKYLLVIFIASIIDFLACLLAFLIDVLLFTPHMTWGSYLVLAAAILVALASLVSCAMRRTLVSRKSRKKQIEQNAEMSGENFYNRQAQTQVSVTTADRQPTMPLVSGANGVGGGGDKLPVFASFENKDERTSDERMPLTARSPPARSPTGPSSDTMGSGDPRMMMMNNGPPRPSPSPSIPRDQYGNPLPGSSDGYGVRRGPSFEQINQRGRGGMPPAGYRGRGGYGTPPARGGYGPPPGGRGGYGPPARGGGYGPPVSLRGGAYGPPPRGYGSARGRGPPPGYQHDRNGPYGTRGPSPGPPSAPGYGSNPSMPSVSTGSFEAYNPERISSELPRAESPPPLPGVGGLALPDQAVEMDATTGLPPKGFGRFGPIRDSDTDIAGMVGLQQGRPPPSNSQHEAVAGETSTYSQEE